MKVVESSYNAMGKQRLSASVDADLMAAAEDAVGARRADSVSAWVNDALRLKLAQDRRLEALAAFVASFEADHGVITSDEMALAGRRARETAVVVRGTASRPKPSSRRRAGR